MRQHTFPAQAPRPFPALIIAPLLLAVCLFPGQALLGHCLPALSGRATIDPSLTILDIPLHLPFPIDLILLPALFIVLYSVVILIFTSRSRLPVGQNLMLRLRTVFTSVFIILFCVSIGGLLSWLLHNHLPAQVRTGMKSLAVNAELHLPYAGYKTIPLSGDTLSLLGLLIGIAIGIGMISKAPRLRRTTPLTREQRMTPYQRMLQERQKDTPRRYDPSHGLCRNEPLLSLQPQAVNYRPLG